MKNKDKLLLDYIYQYHKDLLLFYTLESIKSEYKKTLEFQFFCINYYLKSIVIKFLSTFVNN